MTEPEDDCAAPPAGTIERFCFDFIGTRELPRKLDPGPWPDASAEEAWQTAPRPLRLAKPGRPAELAVIARGPRTPANLGASAARAKLFHTFLHHELQAAELFAWALLAFPETPRAFRRGLLRLCREELAHLSLYAAHLASLGSRIGAFPVRDWFWERVATCPDASAFVALQGIGLEGANLEHSARFAAAFRAAGDDAGAEILERVERDEESHVAFAVTWFEQLSGAPLDYETWRACLPAPLTPAVLRGRPLNHAARLRAGLDAEFQACLAAEPATTVRGAR